MRYYTIYTAFGELFVSAGSIASRYGYVGAEGYQEDPATGLIHVGARYYDPAIGRFLQRDPIGIWGGVNVYVYADNHPTTAMDAAGLATKDKYKKMADAIRRLEEMRDEAAKSKAVQRVEELSVEIERRMNKLFGDRRLRKCVKKGSKKLPFVGIVSCFLWPPETLADVTWPIPPEWVFGESRGGCRISDEQNMRILRSLPHCK